jgi:DNA (cytosine-5)-methyltransferase 1
VLNSKNFGVPQNRERVFIVGHLRGTSRPEVFPIYGLGMGKKNPAVCLTRRGYGSQRNGTYVATDSKTRIRRLTPTECERLQGFPDGWTEGLSDTQRYKCLGNAVTVNVIEAIMDKLI